MALTTLNSAKKLAVVGASGATTALISLQSALAQNNCSDPSRGSISDGLNCAVPGDKRTNLFEGDGAIFRTIVNTLLFLVGAISVIMLIIGGIRYVISSGDQNAVTGAKNTILYAIVGIIVAFLAYGLVNFVLKALES